MKIQILIIVVVWCSIGLAKEIGLKEIIDRTSIYSKEITELLLEVDTAKLNLEKAEDTWKPMLEINAFAAPVYETTGNGEEYKNNYSKWGPFLGAEFKFIQPLFGWNMDKNLKRAALGGVRVAESDFVKSKNKILIKVVEYYYQNKLAEKILDLSKSSNDKLDAVETYLAKDGDPSEYLKFKIKRNELLSKIAEANDGVFMTQKAVAFYIQMEDWEASKTLESFKFNRNSEAKVYIEKALRESLDLKKLEEGLVAKKELVAFEKKRAYPVFFAGVLGNTRYSNVKTDQKNPWLNDDYNKADAGAFVGLKLDFDFNERNISEKKARLELKKLEIKSTYAKEGISLKTQEAYRDFVRAEKNVLIYKDSMKFAKQLFMKEVMKYDLKKKNAKELLEALIMRALSIKDYYTAVMHSNMKYLELMDLCGLDLSKVEIEDAEI